MTDTEKCHSSCLNAATIRYDAISPSGRVWVTYSCDDAEHQASARNMIDALGFRFTGQEATR